MAKAMVAGSATYFRKRRSGRRASRGDGKQNEQQKSEQRAVCSEHQFSEWQQDTDAHVSHCVCHRRADANRRVIHHDVGELEHGLRERFGELQHRLARFLGDQCECNAEEHGEDGDLQDLIIGDGFGDIFGENVQQKVVPLERRGWSGGLFNRRGR